jgi:hypothetical protein
MHDNPRMLNVLHQPRDVSAQFPERILGGLKRAHDCFDRVGVLLREHTDEQVVQRLVGSAPGGFGKPILVAVEEPSRRLGVLHGDVEGAPRRSLVAEERCRVLIEPFWDEPLHERSACGDRSEFEPYCVWGREDGVEYVCETGWGLLLGAVLPGGEREEAVEPLAPGLIQGAVERAVLAEWIAQLIFRHREPPRRLVEYEKASEVCRR